MSEIPREDHTILAELFNAKWDDSISREQYLEAGTGTFCKVEGLKSFIERYRRRYKNKEHPQSWRDFRNFVIRSELERQFDIDEVFEVYERELEAARIEPKKY